MIPNQSVLINLIPLLEAQASPEIENIVTTTDRLFQYVDDGTGAGVVAQIYYDTVCWLACYAVSMRYPSKPRYKTSNWRAYNQSMKQRGSLTVWFDPEMRWEAKPSGKRGRQQVYSGEKD